MALPLVGSIYSNNSNWCSCGLPTLFTQKHPLNWGVDFRTENSKLIKVPHARDVRAEVPFPLAFMCAFLI